MKTRFKLTRLIVLLILLVLILAGCGGSQEPKQAVQVQNTDKDKSTEKDQGEKQPEEVLEIGDAFPGAKFEPIDGDVFNSAKEDVGTLESIDEARKDGDLIGYKILVLPNGYGGPMEIFTYVDMDGKVLKVEIGEHEETEGVGSQTTDPNFLNQFSGISSSGELASIDGVAGATFSSGGVKDGITRALKVFDKYIK